VVLEVANEFGHSGYDHAVLKSATGQAELIRLAQQAVPGLLVSSSGLGKGTIPTEVAEAADYILIHFNTTKLQDIPTRITEARKFGKPVVCNEDEKTGADGAKAAAACVAAGASWGLMLRDHNQKFPFAFDGPADDPIVYAEIQRLTSPIR
jgi:hypothetical protein